jgi:hypothetical protein
VGVGCRVPDSVFGAAQPTTAGAGGGTDLIGLQVAAAVLGGALLPGLLGVLAARAGLEVIGPCLVLLAAALLLLHEALIRFRPVYVPQRSARSQTDAVASSPPRA